ncbi:MAG: hypothetical protein ACOZAJ_03455 [Patescibacteria group bacterium]
MKKISFYVFWAFFFLTIPTGTILANSKSALVTLPSQEIINGNYYASGSTVQVQGQVLSDVFVAGGTVEVSGDVGGDVFVAGGTVRITGRVAGNVRAVGGTVEILGLVEKNVLVGAGTLKLMSGSSILGHVTVGAGTLEMAGTVEGSVKAAGGLINLLGTIKGPAEYWLGKDGQFNIGSQAVLLEQVIYHSQSQAQATIADGAQLSYPLDFSVIPLKDYPKTNNWWNWLVGIFSSLVVAMVLFTWWPKFLQTTSDFIINRPWASLGWGAVWAVFAPLLSIIFLITVIGWPLAVLLIVAYIVGLIIVPVISGLVVANFLKTFKPVNKIISRWPVLLIFFLGIILYKTVVSLPYLGGLISILAGLAVWGALWQRIRLSFDK